MHVLSTTFAAGVLFAQAHNSTATHMWWQFDKVFTRNFTPFFFSRSTIVIAANAVVLECVPPFDVFVFTAI